MYYIERVINKFKLKLIYKTIFKVAFFNEICHHHKKYLKNLCIQDHFKVPFINMFPAPLCT